MSTLPADYDSDPGRFLSNDEWPHDDVHPYVAERYHYDDPLEPIGEARRVLRPGGLFAACSANRDSTPELADVLPGRGDHTTFDGEDAAGVVAAGFSGPGDRVQVEPWDAPMHTLATRAHAAAFLRCHGMSEEAARDAAAGLDLPMTLTMRGCLVYATKGQADGSSS